MGSAEALNKAIELAGKKGTVFVYGIAPDSQPYDKKMLELENVKRVGAREGRVQKLLVDFINKKEVKLDDWVSHILPFNKYNEAFQLVESKKGFKVVLSFAN